MGEQVNNKSKSKMLIFTLLVLVMMASLSCGIPAINIEIGSSQTPVEDADEADNTRTPKPDGLDTGTPTATSTFTPTPTWTTQPTTNASPTPTPTNTPLPCNWAQFISDVTIADNTEISANNGFTKTWRLKNIGSCTWTSGYRLVFSHGDRMNAPDAVAFTGGTVAPGSTVDVSVNLTAPADAGTYQGYFKLRSSEGVVFGIGNGGQGAFFVKIVSVAAAAPPPPAAGVPDLYVQSITLNPNPPTNGQPVDVQVAVYNQGNAQAGAYTVVWYAGENYASPACTWPVDKTNASGGRVLSCNYAGYPSWYPSINTKAIVDSGNTVAESNEGNNTLLMNISVIKP
jgi:hypothetical protein